MNEYDRANFQDVYEGKSLLETAKINVVPWEIGEAQPIVCKILDNMSPGRLLDVGCGLGRNAKAAFDRGYKVTAIDLSSAAINQCHQFYKNSDISFHVSDACDTKLTSSFNVILDSATYHAIPSTHRVAYLKEMRRLAIESTIFHIITFSPSLFGMPKPLASELSEISNIIECSGWNIQSVQTSEYKGNAAAIVDFQKKKGLNIQLDDQGRTKLPVWHLILKV
jgi:ubiquinone/menaquinone biosynthesis C-methylase UbiE